MKRLKRLCSQPFRCGFLRLQAQRSVRIDPAVAVLGILLVATGLLGRGDSHGAEPVPRELVLLGDARVVAVWTGGDAASGLRFQTAAEVSAVEAIEQRTLALDDFVRWGLPQRCAARREVRLRDGSRLPLAESGLGPEPLTLAGDAATANVAGVGAVTLRRGELASVGLGLPADPVRRAAAERQLARAAAGHAGRDVVLLAAGDAVTGTVRSIGPVPAPAKGAQIDIDSSLGRLTLPLDRIVGVRFAAATESSPVVANARLWIGLAEGARLSAADLREQPDGFRVVLAGGAVCERIDRRAIVAMQSLAPRVRYLSDLPTAEYEQSPELAARWPLVRDASLGGGPLSVRGMQYFKGVALHAPARAEYVVPAEAERFVAAPAIEDSAAGGGSVRCRVLVQRDDDGSWQAAAESPVLRGDDKPTSIVVELLGARRIALAVDAADRGDELDRAAWLDARFE